jgi:NADH-quinone oxidoreductase subunit H
LPRLRYDQFMALGWKVLIPVSLAWIMTVAVTKTLRDQGAGPWVTAAADIAFLAAVLAIALAVLSRRRRRSQELPEALPDSAYPSSFPVPPMPGKEKTHVQVG